MAPEIIEDIPYDCKVDIWSLGVTVIEMAETKPPHWDQGTVRALFAISAGPAPTLKEASLWSPEMAELVSKCCVKDPHQRADANQVLQLKFIEHFQLLGENEQRKPIVELIDSVFQADLDESILVLERDNSSSSLNSLLKSHNRRPSKVPSHIYSFNTPVIEGKKLVLLKERTPFIPEFPIAFQWSRKLPNSEKFTPIKNTKTAEYTPSLEDVGCHLKLTWENTDTDSSDTHNSLTSPVVIPGKPTAKHARIEGGPYCTNEFVFRATYFGGEEGNSQIEWYKISPTGQFSLIKGAEGRSYRPSEKDIGTRLEAKYVPIRTDGAKGFPIFVVSKPIQKVVGRIVMYTIPGTVSCLVAKYILSQYAPVTEIDLTIFTDRIEECHRFGPVVPQILFNGKHIGGYQQLLKLHSLGNLKGMIENCLDSEPGDFPSLPDKLKKSQASLSQTVSSLNHSIFGTLSRKSAAVALNTSMAVFTDLENQNMLADSTPTDILKSVASAPTTVDLIDDDMQAYRPISSRVEQQSSSNISYTLWLSQQNNHERQIEITFPKASDITIHNLVLALGGDPETHGLLLFSEELQMWATTRTEKDLHQIKSGLRVKLADKTSFSEIEKKMKDRKKLKDKGTALPKILPKISLTEKALDLTPKTPLHTLDQALQHFSSYLKMRNQKTGIQIKQRGPLKKRIYTFKGEEMFNWLVHREGLSPRDAITQAQEMMKARGYFYRLKEPVDVFEPTVQLFQFRTDIHHAYMLNHDFNIKQTDKLPGPLQFSIQFVQYALSLFAEFASCNGKYIAIPEVGIEKYFHFLTMAAQLKFITFTDLREHDVKAFFLNIRNALTMHTCLAFSLGYFKEHSLDKSIYSKVGYIIDNSNFTHQQIDNAVLRSNRNPAKSKVSLFSKQDSRFQFVINKFDPRVVFGFCNTTGFSTPTIQIFTGDVEKELDAVTSDYLQDQVTIDFKKKEVLLPKVFQDYSKDFGKDTETLLKWVSTFLGKEVKSQALTLSNTKTLTTIKYMPQDHDIFLAVTDSFERPSSRESEDLTTKRETKKRQTLF